MAGRPRRHLESSRVPPLGLYVHVPFCSAICQYCNFNRGLFDEPLKRRYVEAAVAEIRGAPDRFGWRAGEARADTIFFGGGTPSLLDGRDVAAIVAACRDAFDLAPDAEVTIEANPESAIRPFLDRAREAGVNRLSLGVQSFRQPELRRLGRVHDAVQARRAFAGAREAGFDNVSFDLMMWLPEQTVPEWLESVEEAIGLGPEHLSLYMLELYPNAPLREAMARASWSQAPDDDAADMYEAAMARLERAGYRQYEISNVARPGREARHNLKYWTDGEWLGFGPGAHSTLSGSRWKNVPATDDYVSRVAAGLALDTERRTLTAEDRWQEAVITGLRLQAGISVRALAAAYGVNLDVRFGEHLQRFHEAGLAERAGDQLRLTRRGMLVANDVLRVFI
jgi:oxygen-independent coproporphyrinogen-3 oxidase